MAKKKKKIKGHKKNKEKGGTAKKLAAREKAKAARQKKAAARAAAAAEKLRALQLELRRLRSLVKEIAARYLQKQEARLTRLSELLAELRDPDPAFFAGLLHELSALDIKHHKGRRKDLARIEDLAKFQYERLIRKLEEQEKRDHR